MGVVVVGGIGGGCRGKNLCDTSSILEIIQPAGALMFPAVLPNHLVKFRISISL